MTLLEDCDYFIYYLPLPLSVRGIVTPNSDTTFSIFINSRLSDAEKRKAFRHELRHIERDDFYNGQPLQQIEGL